MPSTPSHRPDASHAVERQMRNWELAREQQRAPRPAPPHSASHDVADFVTISRAVGAGGSEIAGLLGEQLHWPVFDREILQAMADDDQIRTRLYEHLDERDVSWIEETVRWIMRGEARREDYFYRLTEAVLALARQGQAVFLGRGADLILPRDRGLRVRLTAPIEWRAEVFAVRNNIPAAMALNEVERIDRERADFRRHHFGKDANEVTRHDLILNIAHWPPAQAVGVIVAALRVRGLVP